MYQDRRKKQVFFTEFQLESKYELTIHDLLGNWSSLILRKMAENFSISPKACTLSLFPQMLLAVRMLFEQLYDLPHSLHLNCMGYLNHHMVNSLRCPFWGLANVIWRIKKTFIGGNEEFLWTKQAFPSVGLHLFLIYI